MSSDFNRLLAAVRGCTAEQKQRVFEEIRDSVVVHDLERKLNVRAKVILVD